MKLIKSVTKVSGDWCDVESLTILVLESCGDGEKKFEDRRDTKT